MPRAGHARSMRTQLPGLPAELSVLVLMLGKYSSLLGEEEAASRINLASLVQPSQVRSVKDWRVFAVS